jgi:hypothetical protein
VLQVGERRVGGACVGEDVAGRIAKVEAEQGDDEGSDDGYADAGRGDAVPKDPAETFADLLRANGGIQPPG